MKKCTFSGCFWWVSLYNYWTPATLARPLDSSKRRDHTHTQFFFCFCHSTWRKCDRTVAAARPQASVPSQSGAEAGGRWTQEPVRPVPLEAERGEEWGARRTAWRRPFIRASYVTCQHLSAFSERLNSAVRPLRSPLPAPPTPPRPPLLSAHARTGRLPVFRQAGERQRCAVEWSVQSDPGCYVIVGSVTMDTAEMCGGEERGGEGRQGVGRRGKGRPGAQQRLDTWIIHDASHPPTNQVRAKMMFRFDWTRPNFQWERKVKLN